MKEIIYLNNHREPGEDAARAREIEIAALQAQLVRQEADYDEEVYGAIFGTVGKTSSRAWRRVRRSEIDRIEDRLFALNAPLSPPSEKDKDDDWTEEVAGASWFAKVFQ